jgi:hypothetical protein
MEAYFSIDLYSAEIDDHNDNDEYGIPDSWVYVVIPEVDQCRRSSQLSRCGNGHCVPEIPPSSCAKRWLYESRGMADETSSDRHESRHLSSAQGNAACDESHADVSK